MLLHLIFNEQSLPMTSKNLLTALEQSTQAVLQAFASFQAHNFNEKPSEEEWSAAQIAEHLLKVDVSTNKALSSEAVPTNRPPDEKLVLIKEAMEGDTKRIAPERVQPSNDVHEPSVLLEKITHQRALMKDAVVSSDMTEACKVYKHPALGTMTKLEWVWFNIYHAERHLRQLQRLKEKLASANAV